MSNMDWEEQALEAQFAHRRHYPQTMGALPIMPPVPQTLLYTVIGVTLLAVAGSVAFYVISSRRKRA